MSELKRQHWDEDDQALDEEFAEIIPFVRDQSAPEVPAKMNHAVMQLARSNVWDELEDNWLLGQGPRVILVTLILFSIAMLILLGF